MPNTHSTLTSLFTDIADSIRNKTGSSNPIIADDFPDAIDNIPSGGSAVIKSLSVTQNGTTTAPPGTDGYNPVIVDVPQGFIPPSTMSITTFTVAEDTNAIDLVNPIGVIPTTVVIVADATYSPGIQSYNAIINLSGVKLEDWFFGWQVYGTTGCTYRSSTTDPTYATSQIIHIGTPAGYSTILKFVAGKTYTLICLKEASA